MWGARAARNRGYGVGKGLAVFFAARLAVVAQNVGNPHVVQARQRVHQIVVGDARAVAAFARERSALIRRVKILGRVDTRNLTQRREGAKMRLLR